MSNRPPYYNGEPVKSRLHQRIRRLDSLLSRIEQEEEKPGLTPAVKVILVLAAITFLCVCFVPVLIFLQLLLR